MKDLCFVFVCNKAYFPKFLHTCSELLTNGKYTQGDICLVIGNDLNGQIDDHPFIVANKIIVKYFPDIPFTQEFLDFQATLNRSENQKKIFQYHKLHVFNTYFKQWKYVLYLDSGFNIYSDVKPILDCRQPNTILAHSDAYPIYEWKLAVQFDQSKTYYFDKLKNKYNLDIDYFQTGIMYFDTNIIEENTFMDLLNLLAEFPICNTNEQGITALYFTNIRPLWKQIPIKNDDTYFYDYWSRNPEHKYIMLKY
jgi:hypothetical protein